MYIKKQKLETFTPEGVLPLLKTIEPFSNSKVKLENALLFISNIYLRSFYNVKKTNKDYENASINTFNEFMPIHSNNLITILGRDYYKDILNQLMELNIIECNDSYCPNKTSKRYRISNEFYEQKPIARQIESSRVKKKLARLKEYSEQKIQNQPYLQHQLQNLSCIHINKCLADEWIRNNIPEAEDFKAKWYFHIVNTIEYGYTDHLMVSPNNKRLHTPFVVLPKELRRFLYLIDKETGNILDNKIEIDGSNTQPILLCIKMEQEGYTIDNYYKELCLNGHIYDYIADDLSETRDWVKERFMDTLLYTKSNGENVLVYKKPNDKNAAKKKFIEYFRDRFPKFYNWLKEVKHQKSFGAYTKNSNNPGGSKLAIEIQQMEANLWIHSLLKYIPEDIIYITIHDSVMIFNPDEDIVNCVETKFKELSKQMYGVEMPVKVKEVS